MSNALAIATVTTALAQIVRTAAQSVVNGADVLTGRPDPAATPAIESTCSFTKCRPTQRCAITIFPRGRRR